MNEFSRLRKSARGSTPTVSTNEKAFFDLISNIMNQVRQSSAPNKYPYRQPRIINHGGDLTKRWYVEYYAYNEATEKLQRVRHYQEINKQRSYNARMNAAQSVCDQISKMLLHGKHLGQTDHLAITVKPSMPMCEAINLFVTTKKNENLSQAYLRRYATIKNHWQKFTRGLGSDDYTLKQIDTDVVRLFLFDLKSTRQLSPKTFNNYAIDLGTFFTWVMDENPNLYRVHPTQKITLLKTVSRKHTAFSTAQLERIRTYCIDHGHTELLLFISMLYYTLIRPGSELRLLKVKNIELDQNRIRIPGDISKSGVEDFVPIAPPLRQALVSSGRLSYPPDNYLFGSMGEPGQKPTHPKYFYTRNVQVLHALGLDQGHYSVYSYKHAGAVDLYQNNGKDIKLVQRLCRHESIEMTNIYLRDLGLLHDYDSLKNWKGAI